MRNRAVRLRGKRSSRFAKKEVMDIDITSLLDILTILLVFLLKSYNSSGILINIPEGIGLPMSESQTLNTDGVIVQVSPTKIWVDDKEVLDSEKIEQNTYTDGGRKIVPLYEILVQKKKTIQAIEQSSPQAKKFSGIINLVVDKTLKHDYLKKIMNTCAESGYKQFKLVVMSENQD